MSFPGVEKFLISMTCKQLHVSFKMKRSSAFFRIRNIHQAVFLSQRHLVVHSGNLHAGLSAAVLAHTCLPCLLSSAVPSKVSGFRLRLLIARSALALLDFVTSYRS